MNSNLEILAERLAQVEQDNAALHARVEKAEARHRHERRRSRVQMALAFCAVAGAILVSPANRAAIAQGYGVTLQQLAARMTAVENKTNPISVNGNNFTITGKNVFIQDGSGQTNGGTGLGNLTIGYNALRGFGYIDRRTGTHNLILGDLNNYSSYGGIAAGYFNTISNEYAAVSGGFNNTASGRFASVSGGSYNQATNTGSSISGGSGSLADGVSASVSGGFLNRAVGQSAAVSGGELLVQANPSGWSGGTYHSP